MGGTQIWAVSWPANSMQFVGWRRWHMLGRAAYKSLVSMGAPQSATLWVTFQSKSEVSSCCLKYHRTERVLTDVILHEVGHGKPTEYENLPCRWIIGFVSVFVGCLHFPRVDPRPTQSCWQGSGKSCNCPRTVGQWTTQSKTN